jgi:hypothetical protein
MLTYSRDFKDIYNDQNTNWEYFGAHSHTNKSTNINDTNISVQSAPYIYDVDINLDNALNFKIPNLYVVSTMLDELKVIRFNKTNMPIS